MIFIMQVKILIDYDSNIKLDINKYKKYI